MKVRKCVYKCLLQDILSFTVMIYDPHADVEHSLSVALVQLILRFALAEFTTLYQFHMLVGVQFRFQAEGLDLNVLD